MTTLNKEKLVFSENFSYTREQLGTHLMNGKPVAYIGASQQLGGYLAIREKQGYNPQTDTIDPAYEYVKSSNGWKTTVLSALFRAASRGRCT